MKIRNVVVTLIVVATIWMTAFVASAKPGEGIKIGNLVLSPFLEVDGTYDDNVELLEEDEIDDLYADLILGLGFLNRTDSLIFRGRGWLQERYYKKKTDKDSEGFGERLAFTWWGNRDDPMIEIRQKFARLEDYEIIPRSIDNLNLMSQALDLTEDRTERVKRDLLDVGLLYNVKFSEKTLADLGYSFGSVDYLRDFYNTVNDPDPRKLYDWYEHIGQLEAKQILSEKTSLLLLGFMGIQDSDGFSDTSDDYMLRAGVFSRTSPKTSIKATAGVEWYDFGGQSESGDDLDVTKFNFDVAGAWQATDKLNLQLSGRNGIQPAAQYRANTKQVTTVQLGGQYQITDTFAFSLAGSYRYDDYIGRVFYNDVWHYKERQHLGARARIDYIPNAKWYDLYLETTFEDVDTNIEDDYNDYDQWRVALGASFRY